MPSSGPSMQGLSRKASAPSSLASPQMEQHGFSSSSGGGGSSFFDASSSSMPSALLPPGPSVPAMPSPAPTGAGAAHVRDVLQRRISSFVYLKRTLLGKSVWLGTVRLTRRDIESIYDVERMRRRAQRALHLGQSLAGLLDIPTLAEFTKAILAVVAELDALDDGQPMGGKAVRNFFRGTVRQKRGAGGIDFEGISTLPSGASSSSAEAGWIQGTHMPFAPDFYQTFLTLLDMLTEVYHKLLQHVPLPGPGGAGASSYFGANASSSSDNGPGSSLAPGETISAANQEIILKVDGKLKKIPMQVSKEIDQLARNLLKAELDSLDPMMRDLTSDGASFISTSGSSVSSSTLVGSSAASSSASTVGYGGGGGSTRSPSLHNASETMSLGRGGASNLLRSPVSDADSWAHGTTTPTSASVGAQSQRQTRQFNPATVGHGMGLSNVATEWGEHAR